MKKLLITLLFPFAFYLIASAVEWNFDPSTWLRVTRLGALTGAALCVLFYPFERKQ